MGDFSIKGKITIYFDTLYVEAKLIFVPDPSGETYNAESLNSILTAAGLRANQAQLEKIIVNFSRAKGQTSELIAKGEMPIEWQPETVVWEQLPEKPDFEKFKLEVLKNSAPPVFYKTIIEQVPISKKTTDSAMFGLIKKEKTETVIEKKEKRIQLHVKDPQMLKAVWIKQGTVAGTLYPAKPGKNGKDVFGKVIKIEPPENLNFLLGEGLKVEKNQIITQIDGFLRIGKQWADIIPFADHSWSLKKAADGISILLDFFPGYRLLPVPSVSQILDEAVTLGAARDQLIQQENLEAEITRSIKTSKSLLDFNLSLNRDAVIAITISDDKLKATLKLVKGQGNGKPLVLNEVAKAISEKKFVGINFEKLKTDLLQFYKSNQIELSDYVLCEGETPVPGKNRELLYHIVFAPDDQKESILQAVKNEPGLPRFVKSLDDFPLEDCQKLAFVKKNQLIARFSPPSAGKAGKDVFGKEIPAPPGNDPVIWLYENIRLNQESLESIEDGILLISEKDGETYIRVIPYRDASITVFISDDFMQATADFIPEYGLGKDLSLDFVLATLKEHAIVHGINHVAIADGIKVAKEQEGAKGVLVAQGTKPVPSGGYKLVWLIQFATGNAVTIRENGKADYKNQDRITMVAANQPVLELAKVGQEGQDGTDITGKTIKAPKDPEASPLPVWDEHQFKLENKGEGNQVLYALIDGELFYQNNTLKINEGYKVDSDVGPQTGNLKFPGSIVINGNVLTGYMVIATGNITVGASVEAALVSADGSIKINEGIKGAGKGTIRAKKTIEAAFAEHAYLMAVGDIVLRSSALRCVIKTNSKLKLLGDKGNLVGGMIRSKLGIEANNIGSEKEIKTEISFGQDYLIKDAIEVEEKEIEKLKTMILQIDKTMREAEKTGSSQLTKLRQDKVKILKLLEHRSIRLIQLKEKYDAYIPAEIIVRNTLYPGVIIESHNRYYEVKQKRQKVIITFDPQSGKIIEKPLSK
ncbi:MAG TPA: FapA family protein [Spirochaetales bacterium]|nr:FapA family protein [Spirochaetales bacterium]HOT58810.1 FapA family protein [Spirochaetales bacterium]HPD80596.1 FapA family protein [Spirochaetales bacterium]HQK33295.1 FapA family protein [Spirochaetales bacterium]HRV27913.1 FapA family protein [Spirochaetia bacterium]